MKVHGNGSIIAQENKSRYKCRKWRLYVTTENGQKTRTVHGNYTAARSELARFIAELERTPGASELFRTYARSWLDYREASGQFAVGTITNNERDLAAFLRSPLSKCTLREIDPQKCRESLIWIKTHPASGRKELTNTTMNKLYITLKAIFAQAVDDGLLDKNPMERIKAPRPDTKEKLALSSDELMSFVDSLSTLPLDGRVMSLYVMALAGLRRSEACGLLDADVTDCIHVHQAVKERDGKIGEPKSRASVRVIPLAPPLADAVDRWRDQLQSSRYKDAETLCCNSRGGIMRPQLLQRWWTQIAAPKLGVDITLHQLRHSNLSMMARYMSPFDLQRYAGWSSLEPAKVYVHADQSAMQAAIASAFAQTECKILTDNFSHVQSTSANANMKRANQNGVSAGQVGF